MGTKYHINKDSEVITDERRIFTQLAMHCVQYDIYIKIGKLITLLLKNMQKIQPYIISQKCVQSVIRLTICQTTPVTYEYFRLVCYVLKVRHLRKIKVLI